MNNLLQIAIKLISFFLMLFFTMGMGLVLYSVSLLPDLPTVEEIRTTPLKIPLRIYSKDNKLFEEYGDERRIPVTLDDVPLLLIDAILVSEDDQFYHHRGIDWIGLIRASISNIKNKVRGQGASTITMQVVRNFFLSRDKTYGRKLKEILLALIMERALTKDEILELYLNKIFLGHRSYGFAAASELYYKQTLNNLSVPEIAMLAGLPQAPSRDNPISNPEGAIKRRDYVLKRLHALGKIDDFSYKNALKSPVTATHHGGNFKHGSHYVSEMARKIIVDFFGEEAYQIGLNVTLSVDSRYQEKADEALRHGLLDYDHRHGFKGPIDHFDLNQIKNQSEWNKNLILNSHLSQFSSSKNMVPAIVLSIENRTFIAKTKEFGLITVYWKNIRWARKYHGPNALGPKLSKVEDILFIGDVIYLRQLKENEWELSQFPLISGALVSLNPNTGEIIALSGGFDYFFSKFNRATQAKRQPGSNIKPFIYSVAFDNGYTASSMLSAAPIVVEDGFGGIWRPQNYSKKFFGPTRLRQALSLSLNLVSVRLLRAIGVEKTINHLTKFGFDPKMLPHSLSLALGSTSVTPLKLASCYSVIANGGKTIVPYLIERIEDNQGNPISLPNEMGFPKTEKNDSKNHEVQNGKQAISPQNAFLTRNIMQEVIKSGTGKQALKLNRNDLAGKTGTTNGFRDAWFTGFNSDVITSVYVGFDRPSHLGKHETGARAALPIWLEFMENILDDYPEKPLVIPKYITSRFINKDSGRVTDESDKNGYFEYYLDGTEPNQPSKSIQNVHGQQSVDSKFNFQSLF